MQVSNKRLVSWFMAGVLAPLALLWLSGCAATQEAKSVEKSGFLGDYSMLKEGQRSTFKEGSEDQALSVYKNPAVDWKKYKKVQLDPVTVWLGPKSQMKDVPAEDRQRLANLLWSKLDEQLRKDYESTWPGRAADPGRHHRRGIIQCRVGYAVEHRAATADAVRR